MIEERDERGRIVRTTGRAPGSRNKRPSIWTVLPPNAVEELYNAVYNAALAGDMTACRLLLDRLDPIPKGRVVALPEVPEITGLEAAQVAGSKVVETMLAGELSPDEAGQVLEVVVKQLTAVEVRGWAQMLEVLQAQKR